jgi:hypothetical protein
MCTLDVRRPADTNDRSRRELGGPSDLLLGHQRLDQGAFDAERCGTFRNPKKVAGAAATAMTEPHVAALSPHGDGGNRRSNTLSQLVGSPITWDTQTEGHRAMRTSTAAIHGQNFRMFRKPAPNRSTRRPVQEPFPCRNVRLAAGRAVWLPRVWSRLWSTCAAVF